MAADRVVRKPLSSNFRAGSGAASAAFVAGFLKIGRSPSRSEIVASRIAHELMGGGGRFAHTSAVESRNLPSLCVRSRESRSRKSRSRSASPLASDADPPEAAVSPTFVGAVAVASLGRVPRRHCSRRGAGWQGRSAWPSSPVQGSPLTLACRTSVARPVCGPRRGCHFGHFRLAHSAGGTNAIRFCVLASA